MKLKERLELATTKLPVIVSYYNNTLYYIKPKRYSSEPRTIIYTWVRQRKY